jgi:broad specificity phosphatase PhoE
MQQPAQTPADSANDPFLRLKSGSTEVYLIRHGDALPEAHEVADGTYDDQALSELGRRQAQALAERMRSVPLAAIYSSPIGRARQTAQYIADATEHEVLVVDGLREVMLGPIGRELSQELTQEQLAALLRDRLREIAVVAVTSGTWASIPGSEPSDALRARVTGAINGLASQHPGQRIAVVSHAGSINAYLATLLGLQRDYFFPAANTSISIARIRGDQRMLLSLNDVAHLREPGLLGLLE